MMLKISTTLLILIGVGFIAIGVVHTQPKPLSLGGVIHRDTAFAISICFTIVCFLLTFSFKGDSYWKGVFIYTLLTAGIATALIIVGPLGALDSNWEGLYERIFLLNGLIWIEVVSFRLLTKCRPHFTKCCTLNLGHKKGQ